MSKTDENYIRDLKEYNKTAEARLKYSIERFDILIISLASGGLVLGINLHLSFTSAEKVLINYGWFCFSLALISNLLSQLTGYVANKCDIKSVIAEIDEIERDIKNVSSKCYDIWEKIFDKVTHLLNLISLISLIAGIILILIFIKTI